MLRRATGERRVTTASARYRLKRIQYSPELLDGFLAHTGVNL